MQVQVAHVAAELAGAATPTRAFMLAPSTYTRPPWRCTGAQLLHRGLEHAVVLG